MVPDERGRAEPQRPPLAGGASDVHVVAGGPEARVEAIDGLERLLPEGHVAAGDVLGSLSEISTWMGPPGALATHSAIHPSPGGGGWAPRRRRATFAKVQPGTSANPGRGRRRRRCRRRSRRSRPDAPVLRARLSPRFSVLMIGSRTRGRCSPCRRSSRRRRRSPRSRGTPAVAGHRGYPGWSARRCGADDDRDAGPGQVLRNGTRRGPLHGDQRWLGPSVSPGETEVPVTRSRPTAVPFVGPREDERPAQPARNAVATCQSSVAACTASPCRGCRARSRP